MKIVRNMFLVAIAVVVVSVNASQKPKVLKRVQTPQGAAFIVTAAGVILDETTKKGTVVRDAGLVGGVYALTAEKPTLKGTTVAMLGDVALTQAGKYVASTDMGKSAAKQLPDATKSSYMQYALRVIAGCVIGTAAEQMELPQSPSSRA